VRSHGGERQNRVGAAVFGGLVGAGLFGGIGYTHDTSITTGVVSGALLLGTLCHGVEAGTMSPVTLCAVLFGLFFCLIGPGCDDYGGNTAVPAALIGGFIGWVVFGRWRPQA
jgi:hypothetical protein